MADAYVPSGYWSVDVPSVQVRARNHARPGKGEVLLDLSASSSSSSSSGGTYVFVVCVRSTAFYCIAFILSNQSPPSPGDGHHRAQQRRGGGGSSLGIVDTGTTLLVPPSHAYPSLIEAITRGLRCSGATPFSSR